MAFLYAEASKGDDLKIVAQLFSAAVGIITFFGSSLMGGKSAKSAADEGRFFWVAGIAVTWFLVFQGYFKGEHMF